MGIWDKIFKSKRIDEKIEAFKDTGSPTQKQAQAQAGEGWENLLDIQGYGNVGLSSFNQFYRSHINKIFKNEVEKIFGYRSMAQMTEISDVIEDATNESVSEDNDGNILHLNITDSKLEDNQNITNNIHKEFNELFGKRIETSELLWDMFRSYMIDGRLYYERVINKNKKTNGIVGIKKLPSETMDFLYDPLTGKRTAFFQYLSGNAKRPMDIQEAEKRDDVVVFYPDQIGFVDYGIYGNTRNEIMGYLEKARVPYNQLKLLETSVIIYRIVRSPERLVFRIDTGNMPKDKALKYVEKIKQKMSKKQTYDPTTGSLTHEPEVLSIIENFYMPQSADGRGSQVESVGGDAKGFTELDDIYYFARKLYRALKYPLSRVSAGEEKREADIMFGGNQTGEITRDEVKWAKFLERQQKRIAKSLVKTFLLHLDFRGLKKQYGLSQKSFNITFNPPSHYREQMEQNFIETRFNNYSMLANNPEFAKSWLMKRFLKLSDKDIKEIAEAKKKDKELGFEEEDRF